MAEYEWEPLTPPDAAGMLAGFAGRWWIAGGWAIDLFAGRTTREHGDMDIAILKGAEPALRAHFSSWDIQIAHDGAFERWTGEVLQPPRHQFWARPGPAEPWALEFLLEDVRAGTWRYRRDPQITLPADRIGRTTRDGIPYLRPEVILLYKSPQPDRAQTALDFQAAAPALDGHARHWLRGALERAHPGHPWVGPLS